MKTVKVNRLELIEKIRANLVEHREDVVEGRKKRQLQVGLFLQGMIKKNTGNAQLDFNLQSHFPLITDHSESYERAIAMLEMSVEDEIVLTAQEFDQYVLDNWSFSQMLRTSLSASGLEKYKV